MTWITIPNVFGGATSDPVTTLDQNFSAIANALNAFNPSGAPAGPGSGYGVRNLTGGNNAGTPTTKYDVAADLVILRDPVAGSAMVIPSVTTITNDITVAGPTVNGRDQAAVFSASSWMHLYFIGDPTTVTVRTISSATAPPTGPALPAGYTMWAYIGAYRLDGSTHLLGTYTRGAQMMFSPTQQVVSTSSTTINTETSVNVATVVPPNALTFDLIGGLIVQNAAASTFFLNFLMVTTVLYAQFRGYLESSVREGVQSMLTLPNLGQQYLYLWNVTTPSTAVLVETVQWVTGYRVPNGGE